MRDGRPSEDAEKKEHGGLTPTNATEEKPESQETEQPQEP